MPTLTLPPVTGGGFSSISACAQYPLARTRNEAVMIKRFITGQEQRWQTRSGRDSFALSYVNISLQDKLAQTAFAATVGASAQSWTFNGDVTRNFCQFTDEAFSWREVQAFPGRFTGSIGFRQTNYGGIVNATLTPGPFPLFGLGYSVGYPFTQTDNFQNARVSLPNGNQVVYQFFGAGLPGFPNRQLYSWAFTLTNMTDADLAALEAHFISAGGRLASFPFLNPNDKQTYTVRYDLDALKINHTLYGVSTVDVQIAEPYLG